MQNVKIITFKLKESNWLRGIRQLIRVCRLMAAFLPASLRARLNKRRVVACFCPQLHPELSALPQQHDGGGLHDGAGCRLPARHRRPPRAQVPVPRRLPGKRRDKKIEEADGNARTQRATFAVCLFGFLGSCFEIRWVKAELIICHSGAAALISPAETPAD